MVCVSYTVRAGCLTGTTAVSTITRMDARLGGTRTNCAYLVLSQSQQLRRVAYENRLRQAQNKDDVKLLHTHAIIAAHLFYKPGLR